ncbi:hydrogenase large subunit [Leptospira sp. GIMC2001]|uniref:hydrogenase large subunit n=1 Tax=Leptospira sp. GIMC2001 TaxID=1513297 RepID=UPI00234B79FD|nr:metal (Ni/Fe) hydrogenase large subunit [Leptospira sp. GIMC2001]WCL48839.1 metal (Ni/Fe) hydrogenase large subunit [Leptospira sp. GIMC2001]
MSKQVIVGFFEDRMYRFDSIKIHEEENLLPWESYLANTMAPISLLRFNFGINRTEDFSGIDLSTLRSYSRKDQLKVFYDRELGLKDINYSGINLNVPEDHYTHEVGPIHAGVIEPGHFRFIVKGDHIQSLMIRLGFQHRKILTNLNGLNFIKAMPIISGIALDTTTAYSICFARCLENLLDFKITRDEELYRLILLETERIACNIGEIGGIAGDIGYYPLLAVCSTERGFPLGWMEFLTGSRFGRMAIRPFHSRIQNVPSKNDIDSWIPNWSRWLEKVSKSMNQAVNNSTIRERMQNVGTVSHESALELGLSGIVARASGTNIDTRLDDPLYKELAPHYFSSSEFRLTGDVWSRFLLRIQDVERSVALIQNAIASINWENIKSNENQYGQTNKSILEAKKIPESGSISYGYAESFRGNLLMAFRWNRHYEIQSSYIRDPSVLNWHALEIATQNQLVSDFPLINKSFNLSYAGVDL